MPAECKTGVPRIVFLEQRQPLRAVEVQEQGFLTFYYIFQNKTNS